jgi:hypothetical protein
VDLIRGFKDIDRDLVYALGLCQLPDPGLGVSGVVLTSLILDVEVVLIVLWDDL